MAGESVTTESDAGKSVVSAGPRPETPNMVYGRLLETVHINGYTAARACSELKWLIADDRWKTVGGGFEDSAAFLAAVDFSKWRMASEERKDLVKGLRKLEASQSAIAKVLGVDQATVSRDLRDANASETNAKAKHMARETGASDENASAAAPVSFPTDGAAVATAAEKKQETAQKRQAKEEEREARRDENREKVAAVADPTQVVGQARFATIVIDPPWDWGDEGDQDQLGRARPTYETWPVERLMELPFADLADEDCHLYLWITNRSLPKGFGLLERWGFRYVTTLTWVKPHYGMGNYFRGQTEHVLFGVKGSQLLKRKDLGTVFHAPRGSKGHSSKPVEFYELVESASPGPYLEMFSRCERADWTSWGEDTHVVAA